MAQPRRGTGLAPEPLDEGLVLGEVGAHDLERDLAVETFVERYVDRRHPAVGQMRQHAIAPIDDSVDER